MTAEPREYTQEEVRDAFLHHVWTLVRHWSQETRCTGTQQIEGLAFSLLTMLDGCSAEMPAFEVIPCPHPNDQEYHKAQGSNWWPGPYQLDGMTTVHGGQMLHELYYDFGRRHGYIEPLKPKIDVFVCGGDVCPEIDGKPHEWDGPGIETETMSSATCRHCGLSAIDWSLLNGP